MICIDASFEEFPGNLTDFVVHERLDELDQQGGVAQEVVFEHKHVAQEMVEFQTPLNFAAGLAADGRNTCQAIACIG